MTELSSQLDSLYDQVPATRCAGSGDCCVLTDEEFDNYYATMFPLYLAEYINIAAYVEAKFPAARSSELLAITEERPRRCPFLGPDHGCTIYPVRPMICRTYGAMNPLSLAREALHNEGQRPVAQIRKFVRREGGMACPRVAVTEPQKVARHARMLIDGAYDRELERLSGATELADGERQKLYRKLTGKVCWPLRWSWGGYNAVRMASLDWIREHLAAYWKKSELADAS